MTTKYAIYPGVVVLSGGAQVDVLPGAAFSSSGAVVTGAPALFTTAMTLGSTTVASLNPNPVPQSITITGGTVTAISINGGSSVGTSGTYTIPVGGSLTVTYSVTPTFTCVDPAPTAGTWPGVTGVMAQYLADYSAGPQVS